MNMWSTRSPVTLANPFNLPRYPGDLSAGDYDVSSKRSFSSDLASRPLDGPRHTYRCVEGAVMRDGQSYGRFSRAM